MRNRNHQAASSKLNGHNHVTSNGDVVTNGDDKKKRRRTGFSWWKIVSVLASIVLILWLAIRSFGYYDYKSFPFSKSSVTSIRKGVLRTTLVENKSMIPNYYRPTATSRRFPKFGTLEFAQQCHWATAPQPDNECTFLIFPAPKGSEGIADWISRAACSYTSAKQTNCQFLMDYGKHVELDEILVKPHFNWTIPHGFSCPGKCMHHSITEKTTGLEEYEKQIGRRLVQIPYYRHAYHKNPYIYRTMYQDLERAVPGFDVETGMACSLGALFDLSPKAAQFEPELFTRILPTLRDENTLVLSIYYRSGQTDYAAIAEKNGTVAKEMTDDVLQWARPSLNCALKLEKKYLTDEIEGYSFSRIVWLMVTDAVNLKNWVKKTYNSQDANEIVPIEERKWKDRSIPREIVTTTARGIHSKQERSPSTADFADALIDWYVIGESDLVIINNAWYSYGATGALRTARPLYLARSCSRLELVHENPLEEK